MTSRFDPPTEANVNRNSRSSRSHTSRGATGPGHDDEHVDGRRRRFCQNCIASPRSLSANLVPVSRSAPSEPAFRAALWPKSAGSNAGRTARGWLSRFRRSHGRSATKGPLAVAPLSIFAPGLQFASGRNRMLTFRIAITAAVMGFVTALTACLIFIQIATFHAAARAAASASMDAASANTLSRLEAEVSELSTLVRVLSSNPSLADSDDRSEVDGAIALFKAAVQELPQADSLYVGYDNGCWLQVRRLDVLDPTERRGLEAPPGAVYNVNLIRPTSGGALPMRRIFENEQGYKIEQLDRKS